MFWSMLCCSPEWWISTTWTTPLGSAAAPMCGQRGHPCLLPLLLQLLTPTALSPVAVLVWTVWTCGSLALIRWRPIFWPLFMLHCGGLGKAAFNLLSRSTIVPQVLKGSLGWRGAWVHMSGYTWPFAQHSLSELCWEPAPCPCPWPLPSPHLTSSSNVLNLTVTESAVCIRS